MAHMEAEVGETVLLTNGEDAASEYAMSYLQSFLPVYQMVNQSTISNVADRYKAIRYAADASLALTASGASWSAALGKRLGDECEDDTPMCSSGGNERLATSATVTCQPLEDERVDSSSESSVSAESDVRRTKRDGEALRSVKFSTESRNVFRLRRRENGRSQRLARPAHRLAILKKLSMKNKSRRRLLRSSWKPRAAVRKIKSLASGRRKFARPFQLLDAVEQERNFDSGIVALQRLVPGGSSMDASVLLDEAVDFVMFLKLQVQALQSVANAVDEQFGDAVSTA